MTGLSASGSYLYLSSKNQNRCYRYVLPGITGLLQWTYFVGFTNPRDLAYLPDNTIWVASDNTTMTLACFNDDNDRIDYIMSDLVPYARGVAVDDAGYLWVSDIVNDVIYKIDLSEGVEPGTGAPAGITASSNPFMGSVTIQGSGFGADATLRIFDLSGRVVREAPFEGSYTWSDETGSGVYLVVVSDWLGSRETLELVKL